MSISIVTTTIHIPVLLEKYAENARFYGHPDVDFIVIGDRKTPSGTREYCASIAARYCPCEYLDIEAQKSYLERFPRLWEHLRFDSIQRRNIGMLKAYENGADVLITIDDDNLIMNQDFVGIHGIAGSQLELPTVESSSGWFNVCSLLEESNGTAFYHRGFPVAQRWRESEAFQSVSPACRMVAVNAGFWLDDPDIDALARLNRQIVVRGLRETSPDTLALQPGTWSPFNSQNTALMRDVIPAYFLSPWIGRYDDIWASYIVNRIAGHLGHAIAFGHPLVRQKRNEHDLWKDLDAERNGMVLTDSFCDALRSIALKGDNYHACLYEIAMGLEDRWLPAERWTDSMKDWRIELLEGLRIWHEVFDDLRTLGNLGRLSRIPAEVASVR